MHEITTTSTPPGDRSIRGFDLFLAVLAFFGVNLFGGIIVAIVAIAAGAAKQSARLAELLQSDFYMLIGLTTVVDAVVFLVLLAVARRFTRRPLAYFFPAVRWTTTVMAAASALVFLAGCLGVAAALRYGLHVEMNMARHEIAMAPKSWDQFAIATAAFVIVVPLFEELFFRGFLFGWLKRISPLWLAMAISAAVFAAFHGLFALRGGISGWVGTGELFVLGLLTAWWAGRSASLWPAYTVHIVNNAAAFSLAFFLNTAV